VVHKHKLRYLLASKIDKPQVAREVVQLWRSLNPPGRFLARKDDSRKGRGSVKDQDNIWFDVGDSKAREKASQCLRERITNLLPVVNEMKRQQDLSTGYDPSVFRPQMPGQQDDNRRAALPPRTGLMGREKTPQCLQEPTPDVFALVRAILNQEAFLTGHYPHVFARRRTDQRDETSRAAPFVREMRRRQALLTRHHPSAFANRTTDQEGVARWAAPLKTETQRQQDLLTGHYPITSASRTTNQGDVTRGAAMLLPRLRSPSLEKASQLLQKPGPDMMPFVREMQRRQDFLLKHDPNTLAYQTRGQEDEARRAALTWPSHTLGDFHL
jgi:hypothetical protein